MELISKRVAGAIFMGGLVLILFVGLFSPEPLVIDFVLILGLFVFTLFLHKPNWGIFLILFIRPSIDKFSNQITINLGKNISLNAAAIFGILTIFLLSLFILKNKKNLAELPLKKYWLLFLLISLFSIIFSIDKIASVYGIMKLLSIFLIFSSVYILTRKERSAKIIFNAIVFSAIFPFLVAIYQLLTGTGVGGSEGIESRLFGTFSHPNPFASFVLISISIALFLIIKEKSQEKKWLLMTFFIIGAVILEQTYARGAWLAFLIFLFIVAIKKSIKTLIGLFILSILLFSFSPSIQNRVQDVYNPPADSSVRWRFEQWDRMYKAYIKKPLTGYGIGTETIVHEREYGPNAGNQYTHNDPLRVALETGIFGIISYISLLILTTIKLLLFYLKEKNVFNKDLILFVFALHISILCNAMSDNILDETVTQWTVWGLIGIAFASFQTSKDNIKNNLPNKSQGLFLKNLQ